MKVEGLDDLVDGEYLHPCASSLLDCAIPASEDLLMVWIALRARLSSTVLLLILAVYCVLS